MTTNGISAVDLFEFSLLSDPQLSPDGNWAVFVQKKINEKEKYVSNLFVLHIDSKKITQFTQGNFSDTQPRWSPDGTSIVFVSNRSGKQQIWRIAFNGGEARQITDFKRGASQPVWSPSGSQLIVTVPLTASDTLKEKETKKEETEEKLKPYITENLQYKSDAKGFSDETYEHLVLIDMETDTRSLLTDGPYDHHFPAFSPDGKRVAYSANRSADPEQTFFSDIYQVELMTGQTEKLTDSDKRFRLPNYSPDGCKLSLLGDDLTYAGATLSRVWSLDLESRALTCLTNEWDTECSDVAINDMGTGTSGKGAVWSKTNDALYFLASEHGSTSIYQVTLDKQITTVAGGKRQVYSFSTDSDQKRLIYAVSQPNIPGDLFVSAISGSDEQRLTEVNEDLLQKKDLSIPEDFYFTAKDGTKLQGWMMKPSGFRAGETYPLVLEIHGGPHAMYSHAFMHEFQVLAGKGYGVLFINPRGSYGYGQQFVDAVRGNYGGIDYEDVMAAVDYALEKYEWIDQTRLGVTGGSYGGFMTNWIVGQTNRFKAAVTQRSISNWISFYGVSDIGYFFTEWEHKTNMMENPDELWRISPLRYVKNIQTPLLILHSENDYRCPIEQAEQLYVALKKQKKPARFVRFPKSNHELSRSGEPALRLSRLNEMTDWFNQYLK
ncbi:S9 family peptidase [Bacillus massiliglaciei]|uniref:S9 family peptidase n=1 Tax=Bacillus massiliglaciei TaxID=1816693 RepID=UPI000AF6B22A|nr:S9 family peptidase [Bacillus massiliglaciei]